MKRLMGSRQAVSSPRTSQLQFSIPIHYALLPAHIADSAFHRRNSSSLPSLKEPPAVKPKQTILK